jgi:hypothetical protein
MLFAHIMSTSCYVNPGNFLNSHFNVPVKLTVMDFNVLLSLILFHIIKDGLAFVLFDSAEYLIVYLDAFKK